MERREIKTMLQLASYLERFKLILPTERVTRNAVSLVVEELCGVLLRDQDIRVQQGVVLLTIHPIHKNEILLRKNEIVELLKKRHLVSVRDVR
jgi:hypothetical protein